MSTVSERVKTRNRANPERARTIQLDSNKGVARKDRPPYPSDDRCELCGSLPKKERSLIFDGQLVRRGNQDVEYRRGWLCYHCRHLVGIIQAIGLKKLITYLIRPFWEMQEGAPLPDSDRAFLVRYLQEHL